jgi:hypothetical protein
MTMIFRCDINRIHIISAVSSVRGEIFLALFFAFLNLFFNSFSFCLKFIFVGEDSAYLVVLLLCCFVPLVTIRI